MFYSNAYSIQNGLTSVMECPFMESVGSSYFDSSFNLLKSPEGKWTVHVKIKGQTVANAHSKHWCTYYGEEGFSSGLEKGLDCWVNPPPPINGWILKGNETGFVTLTLDSRLWRTIRLNGQYHVKLVDEYGNEYWDLRTYRIYGRIADCKFTPP